MTPVRGLQDAPLKLNMQRPEHERRHTEIGELGAVPQAQSSHDHANRGAASRCYAAADAASSRRAPEVIGSRQPLTNA